MLRSRRVLDVLKPSSEPVGAAAPSIILGISADVCAPLVLSVSTSSR